MEENKNLTPENGDENTEALSNAEEIIEEVKEEVMETVEEVKEEVSEAVEEIKETITDIKEEIAPKKGKGGLLAGIIIICITFIAAVLLIFTFNGTKSTEGTGNLYALGFATIDEGNIYHVNLADQKLYKTDLKTFTSTLASDVDSSIYVTNYKGDIYYLSVTFNEETQDTIYEYKKHVDGVNDVVLFTDTVTVPQLAGGYIYYLKPYEDLYSGNASLLYRAELKEGATPELCCDVLCNSFYIDGNDLYIGDVESSSFVKTTLSNAMNIITEAPLADGETRSSQALGAETVLSEVVVASPTINDGILYFADALNQYEFRSLNLATGEEKSFNNGLNITIYSIYGDKIYYHNQTDYCVYKMNFDGSEVTKISAPNLGYFAISHDKFMTIEFAEDGTQYIAVFDLDGNKITDITFTEQYDALMAEYAEMLGEEGITEEESSEEATEEIPFEEVTEEVVTEATVESTEEGGIETTIDLE